MALRTPPATLPAGPAVMTSWHHIVPDARTSAKRTQASAPSPRSRQAPPGLGSTRPLGSLHERDPLAPLYPAPPPRPPEAMF